MRRGVAVAVALLAAAAAGAWALWPRGDAVPAAGGGPDDAAAGKAPGQAALEVTKDPRRKTFTRAETLAQKARPGELRGVVDGPEGAPVGGLRVTARSRTPFQPAATGTTGPDGAFRLQDVGDGQVDVTLGDVPAGWSAASAIASAGGAALRLRLERAKTKEASSRTAVAVGVRDPAGKPVVKARVKVQGRRDEKNFTTADSDLTDADGVAHVEVADPGAHLWLGVERPEDRDDVFDLEIDGWKAHDETLTLKPATRLKGVLTFPEGNEPFPFGQVVWRIRDGPWTTAQIHADGSFSSDQVPPGPMQVVAFDFPVDPPFPPDTTFVDVDPAKGPIRLVAAAPSAGWVAVRFGPLEGHGVDVVTCGRLVEGRDVVDTETQWRFPKDGEVFVHRAVSRASRYQIYARRTDGRIAFATDLVAGTDEQVREVPWTDPKTLGVVVHWPADSTLRAPPYLGQGLQRLQAQPAVDGKPVPWSSAWWAKATAEFLFEGVPEGTWTVHLGIAGAEESLEGSVDVPAGTTGRLDVRRTPR